MIDEIKGRLNILDVVSSRVALAKSGRNFRGLCPFHTEKTPSFFVFPDQGNYYCFGCGASGDAFTFVMRTQNLDFGAALRQLAAQAGVSLPARHPLPAEDEARQRLRQILEAAAQYYHHVLLQSAVGAVARDYLRQRGVAGESIAAFQLGYAPDQWEVLGPYLADRGYAAAELVAAGLVVERESGGHYDRFRGRIMFPIRDSQGRMTGFGGRALGEAEPKYLNSPQTALFDKSATLYGLNLAAPAIRDGGSAVVVEGYLDAIIAHQHGFRNVVAGLGTALTERQVGLLKGLTRRLVLALDPDAAGEEATRRGLEVAMAAYGRRPVPRGTPGGRIVFDYALEADLRILRLPPGKDPDEVILADPEAWPHLVAAAQPVADYYLEWAKGHFDFQTAAGKSAAVHWLWDSVIQYLPDEVQQQHYLQELARMADLDDRMLSWALDARRRASRRRGAPAKELAAQAERPAPSLEEYALMLLLAHPELRASSTEMLRAEDLDQPQSQELLAALQRQSEEAPDSALVRLRAEVGPYLAELLDRLLAEAAGLPPLSEREAREGLADVILGVRERRCRRLLLEARLLLQEAEGRGDREEAAALKQHQRAFHRELGEIFRQQRARRV